MLGSNTAPVELNVGWTQNTNANFNTFGTATGVLDG